MIGRALLLSFVLLSCPAAARADDGGRAPPSSYTALERAVLLEMNTMRKDPRGYAKKLLALRPSYQGRRILRGPGEPAILTVEGVAALDEAVRALHRAPRRLPILAHSVGLEGAARHHAADLGDNGGLGHEGSDGSSPDERVSRFGTWEGIVAENISFGPTEAEEIVIGFIVDDGVPDRGHRDVLLTRELFFAGVACGPHPTYRITCVIDYATALRKKASRGRSPRGPGGPSRAPGPLHHTY